MKGSIAVAFALLILLSHSAHSASCIPSTSSTASGAANGSNCTITGVQSTLQLNFISGFNDNTPLSSVGGNGGTTLGAQRMLSFIKVVETISSQVNSAQTIIVDANFSSLSCDATTATLGSAGPSINIYHSSAPGGMDNNTWYPVGLYNHLANSDNFSPADDVSGGYSGNGTGSDINALFNSNIGQSGCLENSSGWYYGFDQTPSEHHIGFTAVLLHEITHGLGFTSLVNPYDGSKSSGLDDVFSNNLTDKTLGAWPGLSNAQRADSIVSGNELLWSGNHVNTQAINLLTAGFFDSDASGGAFSSGDKTQMYAPCASAPAETQYDYVSGDCRYEGGSSISHFNTDVSPDELMEPVYTQYTDSLGLALYALKDIGWTITSPPTITITGTPYSTNEDTAKIIDASGWGADADGDALTYSISSCPANITCTIDNDGQNLTLTPASHYHGANNTVEITVTDDSAGTLSASDSFNLTVTPVDDEPSLNVSIPDQVTDEDVVLTLDVSNLAIDIDAGDNLMYSVSACATGITCTINTDGSILTLTPDSDHNGAIHTITVSVSDVDGGTPLTDSFNLVVTPINDAPILLDPADQSLVVNGLVSLNLVATDPENDTIIYAATSSSTSAGVSISGNIVTLQPTQEGSYQITVSASDGQLTSNQTFTLDAFEQPSIKIDGTTIQPDGQANIDNNQIEVDVSGVPSHFDYSLEFEGEASNNLLDLSGNTLTIGMPTSGEFAGSYTLMLTDTVSATSYSFIFVRSPGLRFSANKLLEDSAQQTLTIEGGAVGTVYTLTSSNTALAFSQNGVAVQDATAINDADIFNPASLILDVSAVSLSSNVDITVSSIYESAHSDSISLEPKRIHTITVINSETNPLSQSTILLDTALLTAFNIPANYTTDSAGQSLITLPDDDNDYTATVQFSGYTDQTITLNNSATTHTITLGTLLDPLNISGTIFGDENITFNSQLPTVKLILNDDSEITLPVTLTSSTQAGFSYMHDVSSGDVKSLTISHPDSQTATINLSSSNRSAFNVQLTQPDQVVVINSKSSGTMGQLFLLLILWLLIQRKRVSATKRA